jgi:uncharacterized membrane protein YfcA
LISGKQILLGVLCLVAVWFIVRWWLYARSAAQRADKPRPDDFVVGFVTNFLDTLGIGSFATTTAYYKFRKRMPDENIPGTLNVGHALPTVAQALVYITIVEVGFRTLMALIVAAVLGALFGSGVVRRLPRRAIQFGMGIALLAAAALFVMKGLNVQAEAGAATALTGSLLVVGVVGNFVLGALMTLGIGLYAPCLIMVSLLGMNPKAAFPIMMGSCAFLMPPAGLRFVACDRYSLGAAFGLALGGIPAVLIAAFIVRELDLNTVRWLVVVVVVIAATMMLRSALTTPATGAVAAQGGEAR